MSFKNKHIAVIYGGVSSEREVSLKSGKAVYDSLKEMDYQNVTLVDFKQDNLSKLINLKVDIAFNALHGTYGEDGCVQGLLEILGIPYTHSGVLASALAMNKQACKIILQNENILFAEGFVLDLDDYELRNIADKIPCVIKPVSEGSSVGVYIVNDETQIPTKEELAKTAKTFLVEEYIAGRELSVATTDKESLGVMELVPKNGFFNYKNKYTKGMTQHITPANISDDVYNEALNIAYKSHRKLGCRGLTRSDFRYNDKGDGKLYLLEINTHPGMTPISIAPDIAKHKGINFNELVEYLIKSARLDNNKI